MCCLVQAGQFAAILLIVGVALQEYLTFDAEALKYINIIPSYASSLLYTAVCRQPLSTYILKLCHSIIMELSITLLLSLSVHCLQIPNFHL